MRPFRRSTIRSSRRTNGTSENLRSHAADLEGKKYKTNSPRLGHRDNTIARKHRILKTKCREVGAEADGQRTKTLAFSLVRGVGKGAGKVADDWLPEVLTEVLK